MMRRCSRCKEPHERSNQRYCHKCHAAHMRATRPKSKDLPPLAKMKAHCRSYTHLLVKRGKLVKQPCQICGDERSQAHHPDYTKPHKVDWVCRQCHLQIHGGDRTIAEAKAAG
jgi:hypothetical protein